jgi:hypothetical protein
MDIHHPADWVTDRRGDRRLRPPEDPDLDGRRDLA